MWISKFLLRSIVQILLAHPSFHGFAPVGVHAIDLHCVWPRAILLRVDVQLSIWQTDTIPWCRPTTPYSVFLSASVHDSKHHTLLANCPPSCRCPNRPNLIFLTRSSSHLHVCDSLLPSNVYNSPVALHFKCHQWISVFFLSVRDSQTYSNTVTLITLAWSCWLVSVLIDYACCSMVLNPVIAPVTLPILLLISLLQSLSKSIHSRGTRVELRNIFYNIVDAVPAGSRNATNQNTGQT